MTIIDVLSTQGAVRSRDVAARTGLSRQAIHRHLSELVAQEILVPRGKGRGSYYLAGPCFGGAPSFDQARDRIVGHTFHRSAQTLPTSTLPVNRSYEVDSLGRHRPALASGSSRYERSSRATLAVAYRIANGTQVLDEDAVWKELSSAVEALRALSERARNFYSFAFTEMLNNAIDHARSRHVEVRVSTGADDNGDGWLGFSIRDWGVGAFRNVQSAMKLESELAAAQELLKGKTTTAPERHSGEGLFFTSRAADYFSLRSGSLRWVVDSLRQDESILQEEPDFRGTEVSVRARPSAPKDMRALFDRFTEEFAFTKTQITVRLFEIGVEFVARSEAKRLMSGLERFRVVVLDFHGVKGVGQGFADEVFRVWQNTHPETQLVPLNMNEAVTFMVERARSARAAGAIAGE